MNITTALWAGLTAGAIIGATATVITIWAASALGRHLAHQHAHTRLIDQALDDASTGPWPTLDRDYQRLTERETRP